MADTAFFGNPVETFLEDRRLFNDASTVYYTDIEPEHTWVACANSRVVGCLLGCVDTHVQHQKWRQIILPRLAWNLLRQRYHLGYLTWHYVIASCSAALHREYPNVDIRAYPAHLHLNVLASWRGQGLGRQLLKNYLAQLHELGVIGVHLQTTSLNVAACHLYQSLGFQLLDRRNTSLWARYVSQPVENRAYGLALNRENCLFSLP